MLYLVLFRRSNAKRNSMEWKKSIKWLIAFVCAVAFLIIMRAVSDHDILSFDVAGRDFALSIQSPVLTFIMRCITELGGAIVIGIATVVLFFAIKNKRLSFAILGNIVGVLIVNQAFKFLIQRPRPDEALRLIEQGGYSFPSGHSMCSMAFYGFLVYLAFRYFENAKIRWTATISLGLLIVLIGFSRVYLGVHYASDVLAGFLLTIAYLILYVAIVNIINYKTRQLAGKKTQKKHA